MKSRESEPWAPRLSVFATATPAWQDVLAAHADRVRMVEEVLARFIEDDLTVGRANPWAPQHPETTLCCLHSILSEAWKHHRYAVRDLDQLSATG